MKLSNPAAEGEYLCLWESPGMPGIVQLGRSSSPAHRSWTLQSPGGKTRFQVTFCLQTPAACAVEQRVRAALQHDGIPGHDGFFHTPHRFAVQTLTAEAGPAARAVDLLTRRSRRHAGWTYASLLLAPLLALGVTAMKAPESSRPLVPKAKAPAAVPAYRLAGVSMR